jgi:hypothetical protein
VQKYPLTLILKQNFCQLPKISQDNAKDPLMVSYGIAYPASIPNKLKIRPKNNPLLLLFICMLPL